MAGEALARQDDGRAVRPGVGMARRSDLVGIGGGGRPDVVEGVGAGSVGRPDLAGGDGAAVPGQPDLAGGVAGSVAGPSSGTSSDSG
jgi:hypothetical protein